MNDFDESLFPALTALELGKILNRWREPHRRWHGLGHLATLLVSIELESHLSESDREMLRYVALFHDSIYAPMRGDNEEESAQLAIFYLRKYPRQDEVIAAILETKDHRSLNPLSRKFSAWDCAILSEENWEKLLDYEEAIAFEYAHVAPENYRRARERFLRSSAVEYRNPNLTRLAKHVASEQNSAVGV